MVPSLSSKCVGQTETDQRFEETVKLWSDSLGEHLLWLGLRNANGCFDRIQHSGSTENSWDHCQILLDVLTEGLSEICKDGNLGYLFILQGAFYIAFCDKGKLLMIVAVSFEADPAVCHRLFGIPLSVSDTLSKKRIAQIVQ